jgi:hypothetical protein
MNRYQVDIGDAILQAYAGAGARHEVGDRVALDFSFRGRSGAGGITILEAFA